MELVAYANLLITLDRLGLITEDTKLGLFLVLIVRYGAATTKPK